VPPGFFLQRRVDETMNLDRLPRRALLAAALAAALAGAGPAAAQDWKGKARLDGKIVNEKGEPIPKAQLVFRLKGRDGPTVESDSKGHFAYYGFSSGDWDVDISAPGYVTRRTTVHLSELARIPPMEIKLEKAAEAPPAAAPAAPKDVKSEVVPMIEKGNALLEQKDFAGARAEYERALAQVPDNSAILRAVARTYYGEKKFDEAIATLKKAYELAPEDTGTALLLANLELERGNVEEGKALLDKIPLESVKDPGVYLNAGIVFLNKKNPAGAWEQFDRAVRIKGDDPEAYFYRGLAGLQLKKNAEARVDFQKYLELEPTGPQAADAKDLLKSIK
jgi:Flp pilus assembly protein TadD